MTAWRSLHDGPMTAPLAVLKVGDRPGQVVIRGRIRPPASSHTLYIGTTLRQQAGSSLKWRGSSDYTCGTAISRARVLSRVLIRAAFWPSRQIDAVIEEAI